MTIRIAMWSGPRNISTALMRSFGARADTVVSDEPFYGCYLRYSGAPHPLAADIIAAMDCDWRSVAAALTGPPREPAPIWYQKHMAHHMIGAVQPDDLAGIRHAFLIRAPERMIASYLAKRETVSAPELGLAAQRAFFEREADRHGHAPPVVDAADVRRDAAGTLRALCIALDIPWDPAMLAWAPGLRPTDGIWATHWYQRVMMTIGFETGEEAPVNIPATARPVLDACRPDYLALRRFRLNPA